MTAQVIVLMDWLAESVRQEQARRGAAGAIGSANDRASAAQRYRDFEKLWEREGREERSQT